MNYGSWMGSLTDDQVCHSGSILPPTLLLLPSNYSSNGHVHVRKPTKVVGIIIVLANGKLWRWPLDSHEVACQDTDRENSQLPAPPHFMPDK